MPVHWFFLPNANSWYSRVRASVLLSLFWSMIACQTGDNDELEPSGYYLVSAVRPHNTGRLLTEAEEAKTRELANAMEFGILHFLDGSKLRSIRDGQLRDERFAIEGVTMTIGDSTFKNVRATEFGFIMTITKRINRTPVDFRHRVYRFKLGDNEQRFSQLAQSIFTQKYPRTEEEIRQRVQQTLAFYALYFQAIHDSKVGHFKPGAVSLPIQYFSHGIGLKTFEFTESWARLYATEEDARKAHRFLSRAISGVDEFPKRDNFVLEYAAIFKEMSENL